MMFFFFVHPWCRISEPSFHPFLGPQNFPLAVFSPTGTAGPSDHDHYGAPQPPCLVSNWPTEARTFRTFPRAIQCVASRCWHSFP